MQFQTGHTQNIVHYYPVQSQATHSTCTWLSWIPYTPARRWCFFVIDEAWLHWNVVAVWLTACGCVSDSCMRDIDNWQSDCPHPLTSHDYMGADRDRGRGGGGGGSSLITLHTVCQHQRRSLSLNNPHTRTCAYHPSRYCFLAPCSVSASVAGRGPVWDRLSPYLVWYQSRYRQASFF